MNQTNSSDESLDALPLYESTFLILVSLEDRPKHGYAIMKEVKAISRGRVTLSTGTLYGTIKRLLEDEWICRVEVPEEDQDGRGRKSYALTARGWRVLQLEAQRLRELVAIASRRLAPGAQSGGD